MNLDEYLLPPEVFTPTAKATRYVYREGILVEVNVHTGQPVRDYVNPFNGKVHLAPTKPRVTKGPVQPISLRAMVYQRDGGCVRCRSSASPTMHHVVHRSAGGRNSLDNLQALCRPCHNYVHHVLRLPSGTPVPLGEEVLEESLEYERTSTDVERYRDPRSWWVNEGRAVADRAYQQWTPEYLLPSQLRGGEEAISPGP